MAIRRLAAFACMLAVLGGGAHAASQGNDKTARWTASWGVAASDFEELASNPVAGPQMRAGGTVFRDQTLRQLLPTTLDGHRVRVRFSNLFGKRALHIAAAGVARSTGTDAVSPISQRVLRFGGRDDVTLAPGAQAWSDGVDIDVEAGQSVVVSTYLDQETPYATVRVPAPEQGWVMSGNAVAAAKPRDSQPLAMSHIVTGLDVWKPASVRVVVAFGDSITAGGDDDAQGSYPDFLAKRLRAAPRANDVSVINAGIGGNRLLLDGTGPRGVARFARDTLGQSGVSHVIILIGTNDIGRLAFAGMPGLPPVPPQDQPSVERVTAGLLQLVREARSRGLKVMLGTITPFRNSLYGTPEAEALRVGVNRWIRSRQDVDAVVDFDFVLRGRDDPLALDPRYDSGDHLHPNRAGNAAMAAAIDLHQLQE